jgi:hypothetical protein
VIMGTNQTSAPHILMRTSDSRLHKRLVAELDFPDEALSRIVHPTTIRATGGPQYLVEATQEELEAAVGALLGAVEGQPRIRGLGAIDCTLVPRHTSGVLRFTGCQGDGHGSTYRCTELTLAWCRIGGRTVVRTSAIRAGVHHCERHGDIRVLAAPADHGAFQLAWRHVFPRRDAELRERRALQHKRRVERLLSTFGHRGIDDRLSLRSPHVAAHAPGVGLLLADNPSHPVVVQVVVRDSSTGLRHAITVPPRFARPSTRTYQRLGSDEARVRAAIAWTFRLAPEAYAPSIET